MVSNFLSVSNIEGAQMIRISNILGESVQNIKVLGNYTTINVSKLSKGVYFISLIDANGVINTRKFIKE
ncbi:MAG: T9SS type A sorting domain-containing protein [Bacteroidales bacterium]